MTSKNQYIYADNSATSFPKPEQVKEAISTTLSSFSLSPGRAAHRFAHEASRIVFTGRESLAEFFNCPDSSRVIFTSNVTESLNMGILGLSPHHLGPGDHVITTPFEHNSVMRPLRYLEKTQGIEISFLPLTEQKEVDVKALDNLLQDNTRLIVINHVSNVSGSITDLAEIGRRKGEALLMVDAAQSAGIFPIDVKEMNIDFLAFTGHKALFGPTGIGGFYLREGIDLRPLKMGGTGSNSEIEIQPDFVPDRYEAGTPNTLGIAGLTAGIDFIKATGLDKIRKYEDNLLRRFLQGLARLKGIKVLGPDIKKNRAAVVSLQIAGWSESELARRLDRDYGIMVRAGLQCAPAAHRILGSFPEGSVRFSFGFFNTEKEVDACLAALQEIITS